MLSEGEQVYRKSAKKNKGVVLSGGWRQARVLFANGEVATLEESELKLTGEWVSVENAVLAAILKVQAGKNEMTPEALKIVREFGSARYSTGYDEGGRDEINAE